MKGNMTITKKDRITTGAVDYFPNALAAIGRWSEYNNQKYPPATPSADGSPRWSFDVSTDHADAIGSHLAQRGTPDEESGFSHSVPLAWRALALLESELVAAGAKPGLAVIRAPKPEPEPMVDPYHPELGYKERWGIFEGDHLVHGYYTILRSRDAALTSGCYAPETQRVARIVRDGRGGWVEKKEGV